jgi:hypothetical protein
MRWLMTLGERSRPETPTYAECPGPNEVRAVALVDDCGQLFPILPAWRRALGRTEAGDRPVPVGRQFPSRLTATGL